jgi:hypothetical protein
MKLRGVSLYLQHCDRDTAFLQFNKWLYFITSLGLSGHYTCRQFNIQQLYVLPTQCIYAFCVNLRTNSEYFPIQR